MTATMEDDDEPPQIEIREAVTGEAFDLDPSPELWRDMQAYCAVTGLTVEGLINAALTEFFQERDNEPTDPRSDVRGGQP
jgi:hypothetical protein